MTIRSEVIHLNIVPWVGKRPRLISNKLTRRVLRVLLILVLALIIFLVVAQPVVAAAVPSVG